MREVRGLGGLREGLYDAFAGENGTVDDVCPFGDAECTAVVLFLDRVTDVDKFAVFKDEEVVLRSEGLEAGDCFAAEIGENVDVGFDDGDVGAEAWMLWHCG